VRLDALATLAHACDEVVFPEGSIIARVGEPASASYVIVDGELRASYADGDVVSLGPGEVVAPFETLAEVGHASTLEVTRRLHVLRSSGTAIFDVIEDHTELGLAMIRSFAAQLLESEDLARRAASLRGVKRLRS
jgi:CRP-like cAMP-binding protein